MCYLMYQKDEIRGCVRKDDKIEFRGTSCILYVHKHRDTSPKMMSEDAHNMMMMMFMWSMTLWGSTDLWTSL